MNYEKLLQYGLKIVSRKRYTEAEMKAKLERFFKKKGMFGTEVIEKVIRRLDELNYLNDEEYAKAYVSDRVKFRPKGKFLLKRELTKKGVEKELIQKTLDGMEIDEVVLATEVLERVQKKWAKFPIMEQRNKAYRYLAARGFNGDSIYKAVSTCYNRVNQVES